MMIKSKKLITLFTLLLTLSLFHIENASAGRGRRGGGASRRTSSSVNMQNRGNFSGGQRSTNRSQNIRPLA